MAAALKHLVIGATMRCHGFGDAPAFMALGDLPVQESKGRPDRGVLYLQASSRAMWSHLR